MKYIHAPACLGTVDLRKRECQRCHKKWSRLALWVDPSGIRPMREPEDLKPRTRLENITDFQQLISSRIPGGKYAVFVANHYLPNWPTWARVLSTVCVLGGIVYLITWLIWLR